MSDATISRPQRKHQAVDPRPNVTVQRIDRPARTDDGEFSWTGPVQFGDNEEAVRHKIKVVEPARRAQFHAHVVAPLATITTIDGRRLEPGDPVRPGVDIPGRMVGYLRDLGTILSLKPEEIIPRRRRKGDTHAIAEGQSVRVPGRLDAPNAHYPGTVCAADFDEPAVPAREGKDWSFRVEPKTSYMIYQSPVPARPAKPAIDGAEVLAKLEADGKVRALSKEEREEIDAHFPEREEGQSKGKRGKGRK